MCTLDIHHKTQIASHAVRCIGPRYSICAGSIHYIDSEYNTLKDSVTHGECIVCSCWVCITHMPSSQHTDTYNGPRGNYMSLGP